MPAVMPGGVQSIQPTAHMVQILWHDPEPVYFTQLRSNLYFILKILKQPVF